MEPLDYETDEYYNYLTAQIKHMDSKLRVKELEEYITLQAKRVEELNKELAWNAVRIAELERQLNQVAIDSHGRYPQYEDAGK